MHNIQLTKSSFITQHHTRMQDKSSVNDREASFVNICTHSKRCLFWNFKKLHSFHSLHSLMTTSSSLRPPDGSSEEKETMLSNSKLQKRLVDLLWNCQDLTLFECKVKYNAVKGYKKKQLYDDFSKRLREKFKRYSPMIFHSQFDNTWCSVFETIYQVNHTNLTF